MKITQQAELAMVARQRGATVVSIDMFDTLVFRRCARPTSVFDIQHELMIGKINGIPRDAQSWVSLRMAEERKLSEASPLAEITLDQIYKALSRALGLDSTTATLAMQAELEAERRVIRPYPGVVSALKALFEDGITVVVTTDTYLPEAFIRSIVSSFLAFDHILICSSTTGVTKRAGGAFQLLLAMGGRLVHFGDNPRSDVAMARANGVEAVLVDWERADLLRRASSSVSYLNSMGVIEFDTPADGDVVKEDLPRAELAWRWAMVQTDYLLAAAEAARKHDVDEVWMLSRDCESLYAAIESFPAVFGRATVRYVRSSRAASYPIMAVADPSTFARWLNRSAESNDVKAGHELIAAYNDLISPNSKSVLILDVGWKGRLQSAFQAAMPRCQFRGFYFSLDVDCEPDTLEKSDVFEQWTPSLMVQPAVELLAGYLDGTCTGYRKSPQGRWEAVSAAPGDDTSPLEYARHLRRFLGDFLPRATAASGHTKSWRRRVLKELLMYPDRNVAAAVRGWSSSERMDGRTNGNMVSGGTATVLSRIVGRAVDGNLWPPLGFWSVTDQPCVVRLMQSVFRMRKAAFYSKRSRS